MRGVSFLVIFLCCFGDGLLIFDFALEILFLEKLFEFAKCSDLFNSRSVLLLIKVSALDGGGFA